MTRDHRSTVAAAGPGPRRSGAAPPLVHIVVPDPSVDLSGTAKVDAYLVRQGKEEEDAIVEFRLEHAVGSPDDIAALGRMLVDRAVKEITSR